MSDEGNIGREWTPRLPEGYYDAIQATGTMVAPILAGFAFAILAIVLVPPARNEPDPLRWRDAVLALLVFSALLLIISTQAAIRARATLVKPDELRAWYPLSVDQAGRPNQWLEDHQKTLDGRTLRASGACRQAYNAGTLLFFTAIAILLVPSGPVDDARRVVLGAAAIAVTVEAAWLTGTSLRQKLWPDRLPTLLTPTGYAAGAVVILAINSTVASRAAAATSMAIACVAAGAAAFRLISKGVGRSSRNVGFLLLVPILSAAAATGLLLSDWGAAAPMTYITAAVLFAFLLVVAVPGGRVKGPDDA